MFKKFKFGETLNLLIEVIYLAIILLVPITFAIFLKNANVFELNKLTLFQSLTGAFLTLVLIKVLFIKSREPRCLFAWPFFKKYLLVPLMLLVVWGLSLFFSLNPDLSFWGLYDRQEGYLSHLIYIVFAGLLVYQLLQVEENPAFSLRARLHRIIIVMVSAASISSIYGVLQIMGIDFLNWSEPPFLTHRATSTLGQPNFLGSFLALVLPFIFYLFIVSRQFLLRFLWILLFAINLICLFFTASRGAWLGVLGALVIVGVIYFWPDRAKIFRRRNYPAILGVGLILIIFATASFGNEYVRDRLASSLDPKSGSVAARMHFWQASLKSIPEKIFWGYGLENQEEPLVRYYETDWGVYGNVNARTNRAHNLILDTLLAVGLFGFLVYLWLLVKVYKLALQNLRGASNKPLAVAIFFGLTAYLISLLFGFSFVVGNVYFWLLVVLIIITHHEHDGGWRAAIKSFWQRWLAPVEKFRRLVVLKVIILAVVVLGVGWQINYGAERLIADHYFKMMQDSLGSQDYFTGYTLYGYLKDTGAKDDHYDVVFVKMMYNNFFDVNALAIIKVGQEKLQAIVDAPRANTYENLQMKAKAYAMLGDYQRASDLFDYLIRTSPNLPENYVFKAKMLFHKKDYVGAKDFYAAALSKTPDPNDPHLNWQHLLNVKYYRSLILRGLADIDFATGQYAAARFQYNQALISSFDISLYKKMADTYYQEKNFPKAVWFNQRGMIISPSDYTWSYAIALLYQEQGDIASALKYARQAFQLNNTNPNVKNLMETLEIQLNTTPPYEN